MADKVLTKLSKGKFAAWARDIGATVCAGCGRLARYQPVDVASAVASVGIENPRVAELLCRCAAK